MAMKMPGSKRPDCENFSIMGAGGGTSTLGTKIPSITGKTKYAWDSSKLYNKSSSSFMISRPCSVRSGLNWNPRKCL